jgi:hypothetical protein
MKQLVWLTLDNRLVVVWWLGKKKQSREHGMAICRGLEIGGAFCLGEL